MRLGQWQEADVLLRRLAEAGYRPWRGARLTSSLAYHRARCKLATGDRAAARRLIRRALDEAPGDVRPLALAVAMGELVDNWAGGEQMRRQMQRLHDPVTVDLAMAEAWYDVGRPGEGRWHALRAAQAMVRMTASKGRYGDGP